MRLIDVGSVVQRKPTHGCTGGVTAGIMPVWYAAIETAGSGTNVAVCIAVPGVTYSVGAAVAFTGGGANGLIGCTGCVSVDGGVGGAAGCVCVPSRLIRSCRPCCSVLICVCCVAEGALRAPVTPRSPAARMNIDEANAASILPKPKSSPPAMTSTTATTIAPISLNGLVFMIAPLLYYSGKKTKVRKR